MVRDSLRKNFNESLKGSENFTCLTVYTGSEKFKAVRHLPSSTPISIIY